MRSISDDEEERGFSASSTHFEKFQFLVLFSYVLVANAMCSFFEAPIQGVNISLLFYKPLVGRRRPE
jgi:hypothetical protein